VASVDYSSDGKLIAVGISSNVIIYDAVTFNLLSNFSIQPTITVKSVKISSNFLLAVGSANSKVLVFDLLTSSLQTTITTGLSAVNRVDFTPSGDQLAICGNKL
jgi:WD40 repeat protein